MSDEERFQIIGKVVSDHESAKKHLAMLRAKAKSQADLLSLMGSALTGEAEWSVYGNGFKVKRFNRDEGAAMPWPTAEDLATLLNDIVATNTRIAALEKQRKDLGV